MPQRKTPSSSNATKTKQASGKRTASKSAAKKPATSTKKKAPTTRKKRTTRAAADEEVTIDRRRPDRRASGDAGTDEPKLERRQKVNRRRQIDPTTCERDYSEQEVEFMNALDEYKRKSGRMFPTCSEVLEVIRDLGYVQLSPAERAARTAEDEPQPWSPESEEVDADAELVSG